MNFRKITYLCFQCALLSVVSGARADVAYSEADDNLTIVRMNVTPAAEPSPAFKFRLMKHDLDLKPGNAAPYYYRALLLQPSHFKYLKEKFGDEPEGWYGTGLDAVPLAKLPLEKLRERHGDSDIMDELAEATSRRDCNWDLGIDDLRGVKAIAFLLHDFQDMRQLARILALNTRFALAEHRHHDAIDNLQLIYRLAGDTAKVPFLVCGLIGIAEAQYGNGIVTELIAEPNSPNLYWALTELPEPLVDMHPAARLEMDFGPRLFPFIQNAETTERSPQEWNRLYTKSMADLSTVGNGFLPQPNDVGSGFYAMGFALLGYSHAKAQLVAEGLKPQAVDAMSVGQVMAIYTDRKYQSLANDYEKLWYVPFWEMRARKDGVEKRMSEVRPNDGGADREILPIAQLLLPATDACRSAQVRLEREFAALRVIEALRMYAAAHAGGLPKSLDEIAEVPVPLNPATGKPFSYRLEGATAVLELPKSDGISGSNVRYEISIARAE